MKLLLADDHTLFRDALVQYISGAEPDAEIEVAKDLPKAKNILDGGYKPDLVLLDLQMPGMEGMKGFEEMLDNYPDTLFGLMSGTANSRDIQKAMDLGAAGYFPKTLSGKYLLNAIQLVLNGGRFLPLDDNNKILPSYYNGYGESAYKNGHANGTYYAAANDGNGESRRIKLTPREEEVLGFLMKGASNKEIARELDIQVVTVKLHVRGICRKFGAQNRTQAALKARTMGFAEGI